MEIAVTKIPTNRLITVKTEDNAIENVHGNNKASNESKTTASAGSKTGEKEEIDP